MATLLPPESITPELIATTLSCYGIRVSISKPEGVVATNFHGTPLTLKTIEDPFGIRVVNSFELRPEIGTTKRLELLNELNFLVWGVQFSLISAFAKNYAKHTFKDARPHSVYCAAHIFGDQGLTLAQMHLGIEAFITGTMTATRFVAERGLLNHCAFGEDTGLASNN